MSKKYMNDEMFADLIESTTQAVKISKGTLQNSRKFILNPPDIAAIRIKTEKSQEDFARMIGVSVGTLRNWEQGRRKPEVSASGRNRPRRY